MPSLQVREIPQPLYQRLMEDARRAHRSLAQQAVVTLARGMELLEDPRERRQALLARIKEAQVCPLNLELPDAAEMVKEDRNR